MTYTSLLIHTITIYNTSETTSTPDAVRYGDIDLAYDVGFSSIARVEPTGSNEQIVDRDTRVNAYTVFLPLDTPIDALSKIEWEGHTLRVNGEPSIYADGVGPHHTEVVCEEVVS